MRAMVLMVAVANLATSVAAQDFGAPGAVEVDAALLRNQILSAQTVCRDAAIAEVRADRFTGLLTRSPLEMIMDAGLDAATDHLRTRRQMRDSINDCMARRGYVPSDADSQDDAALASAKAGEPDPWATVVRFTLAPSRSTTVVTSVDQAGNAVSSFTVGRF
jgi:hypothetical protein